MSLPEPYVSLSVGAAHITVVGSANHDMVFLVSEMPKPGETVISGGGMEFLGGKGQCQSIAARRFGTQTAFVASIGQDEWGEYARDELERAGVDISRVRSSSKPTGRAIVIVNDSGENSIVVDQGANAELRVLNEGDLEQISAGAVLLVQLEAGVDVAFEAMQAARSSGTHVILNAAPARDISTSMLASVDHLIVNEIEVCQLAGVTDPADAANVLLESAGSVIVTLGSRGGRLHRRGLAAVEAPALLVEAIDTTGAGDAVSGVFAAALVQGFREEDAFRLGLVAGSLASAVLGCVPSAPDHEAVRAGFRALYGREPERR